MLPRTLAVALLALLSAPVAPDAVAPVFARAHENGRRFETAVAACDRLMRAWLEAADPKTLLLPDRLPGPGNGLKPGEPARLYTPAQLRRGPLSVSDPHRASHRPRPLSRPHDGDAAERDPLHDGPGIDPRESRPSIPATLGPPSLFGAGEYAKDGLLSVTEYLGRTPYYARMLDMVADAMNRAPVDSRFGKLPASDAELNGDYLQVLARLGADDRRPAVCRVGAPHRRRLPGRGRSRQPRRPERQVGFHRAHRRSAPASARSRQRARRRARAAVCATSITGSRRAPRSGSR